MAEYIERESALYTILCEPTEEHYPSWYAAKIEALHTADVAPVVHGKWVHPHWKNSDFCYDCSVCGSEAMHQEYRWRDKKIYPICPWCGAKMRENNEI